MADERVARVALSVARTRTLLDGVAGPMPRALLSALALTLQGWRGDGDVVIDLEGHGRDAPWSDVDLAGTVGWFTSLYPVRLTLGDATTAEAALAAVPGSGLGYGVLRHLGADPALAARLAAAPPAEVALNYLGQTDAGASTLDGFAPLERRSRFRARPQPAAQPCPGLQRPRPGGSAHHRSGLRRGPPARTPPPTGWSKASPTRLTP